MSKVSEASPEVKMPPDPNHDGTKKTRALVPTEQEPFSFCDGEFCRGIAIPAEALESEIEAECPICLQSLNSQEVARISECGHLFCRECETLMKRYDGCPICRGIVTRVLHLDLPVKAERLKWLTAEHNLCIFCPRLREFGELLPKPWLSLVDFVLSTGDQSDKYYRGIVGIEHLSLGGLEREGRLLDRGTSHAVISTASGRTAALFSCYLPSTSLRVMISPSDSSGEDGRGGRTGGGEGRDDFDFEVDNDCADRAVAVIIEQLCRCWRAFVQLLDRRHIHRAYVRRFERVTCSLLLSGFHDMEVESQHRVTSPEAIRDLPTTNFDPLRLPEFRRCFPLLDVERGHLGADYLRYYCCGDDDDDDDDDDVDDEEESEYHSAEESPGEGDFYDFQLEV